MTLNKYHLIGTFTLTFVTGVAAGFLLGKQVYKTKYAALAEQEFAEWKEAYLSDDYEDSNENAATTRVEKAPSNSYTEAVEHYSELCGGQEYDFEPNRPGNTQYDSAKPYLITESAYSTEFLIHDKLVYTFFMADGTLMNENEEIITDENYTVGTYNLDCKYMDQDHIVYVRNEKAGADYAIEMNPNSYQEMIQGG